MSDIDHPKHYQHPSGIETIEIAEQLSFIGGNVIKYLMRWGLKDDGTKDLEKARWYCTRRIRPWTPGRPLVVLLEEMIQAESDPLKRALFEAFYHAQREGERGYASIIQLINERVEP